MYFVLKANSAAIVAWSLGANAFGAPAQYRFSLIDIVSVTLVPRNPGSASKLDFGTFGGL